MLLELNGIRIEVNSHADIARFKGFGYIEVKDATPIKEKAVKDDTDKDKPLKAVKDDKSKT